MSGSMSSPQDEHVRALIRRLRERTDLLHRVTLQRDELRLIVRDLAALECGVPCEFCCDFGPGRPVDAHAELCVWARARALTEATE